MTRRKPRLCQGISYFIGKAIYGVPRRGSQRRRT
jgi:hypothetical protein